MLSSAGEIPHPDLRAGQDALGDERVNRLDDPFLRHIFESPAVGNLPAADPEPVLLIERPEYTASTPTPPTREVVDAQVRRCKAGTGANVAQVPEPRPESVNQLPEPRCQG